MCGVRFGKPGGHMCELEDRMHGIDSEWEKYFKSGCDEYEELRARRKDLHTRYGGMERRERVCSSEQLA